MNEVSQILLDAQQGDSHVAQRLLPLVYDELRRLAAHRLAHEKPGQTLNATALVHEVYLRLVDVNHPQHFQNRAHFFAAAAEAMRRILVEEARRKAVRKRIAGPMMHLDMDNVTADAQVNHDDLLAVHEALAELEVHDEQAARLVKLRYFVGLTHEQAAETMGLSRRVADRIWAVAKSWLYRRLNAK